MKVVLDTNVLMAGLLRDSIVRGIILKKDVQFYIPEAGVIEVRKYRAELCEKSGYSEYEFDNMLSNLLGRIHFISLDRLIPFMTRAEEIMKDIDIKDSPFVAACLAIEADGIWSFDNHFKKQKKIRVFNISDFVSADDIS